MKSSKHVVIAVKTTEGGMWIIPQVLEAVARGHRVTVVTPAGTGRLVREVDRLSEESDLIRHVASPFDFSFGNPGRAVRGLRALRRLIQDLAPDVVLYHLFATALAIRFASLGLGVRRVHMIAGPLYLDSPVIRAVEAILWRLDDVIVCGSWYTRHRYEALGASIRRMDVIPYGVDTERFSPDFALSPIAARKEFGIPADAFVAVMVAYVYAPKSLVHRGEGIKGHRFLLDAWTAFHQDHPHSRLLLVGGGFGPEGSAYRTQLIEAVGGIRGLQKDGVIWVDSVDDVRSAYQAADVSVSPSLSENHGAALEASAMAVPSIVSDAGALPETVSGASGWVCRSGSADELRSALANAHAAWRAGDLSEMGKAARSSMLTDFDVRKSASRVIDRLDA
ncbi:glycosyltransferase family 4 protein [Propionibacteriaceae bacterium Y1685]|uniref:glycosyltransferase family 4 protein n=1 Tax=Microlunatus sp. Y1700 TaxID=3418487 RepID=UPI003B79BFCB